MAGGERTKVSRFDAIIKLAKKCGVAADIGCDHGLLGKELIARGLAKKVIAGDISAPSLEKANKLAYESGISGNMETRLGDGLSVLRPGEANVIVIAGMGGMQIVSILSKNEETAKSAARLVLLPHKNVYELRKYLDENGYEIADEELAYENGRYYEVICAIPGKGWQDDEFYYLIGQKLVEKRHPLLAGFLVHEIQKQGDILKKAGQGSDTAAYIGQKKELIRRMEEILKWL